VNRGIEDIWPSRDWFEVACDCGIVTDVHVVWENKDGETPPAWAVVSIADQEVAITCEGCGSVHWLTVSPRSPDSARSAP